MGFTFLVDVALSPGFSIYILTRFYNHYADSRLETRLGNVNQVIYIKPMSYSTCNCSTDSDAQVLKHCSFYSS